MDSIPSPPLSHSHSWLVSHILEPTGKLSVVYVTDAKCCGVTRRLCLLCFIATLVNISGPSHLHPPPSITVVWNLLKPCFCAHSNQLCCVTLNYYKDRNILHVTSSVLLIRPWGWFPNRLLDLAEQIHMRLDQWHI
jgi:hypothetical protein